MKPVLLPLVAFAGLLLACAPLALATSVFCDVIVVGGGAGGLHTAWRLGASGLGSSVCLVEKEARLGGRIYDVSLAPGGPVFGTGALRVMETQDVLFGLADELGLTLVQADFEDDLLNARGYFAASSDELNTVAYPLVDDAMSESALYDLLRFGPERANASAYPDFRSYVRAVAGEQGYHFLRDVFRFRGDFTYPLDAAGYLDYFDEEWDVCCTASYPVGGMSAFIGGMEAKALAAGVRIFKGEPVLSLSKRSGPRARFVVKTETRTFRGKRVVVAADPVGFQHVTGNIAEAIQAQPQFRALMPVRVATVTQWWPENWWADATDTNVHRAWTTEHCLNFIEIPVAAYAEAQNVTRSVYTDDLHCVDFWQRTAARSTAAVNAEIRRGLEYLFPNASIPAPLKTHVQIWPNAWYWLGSMATFTNADIADWATDPLNGEHISLVGEAYNPQRSGWSDGAYKSSLNTLSSRFNIHPPSPPPPRRRAGAAKRTTRN